jgi:hypothetical protein
MSLRPKDQHQRRSSRSKSEAHTTTSQRRERSRSHSHARKDDDDDDDDATITTRPAEYVYTNSPASVPRHISPVVAMPCIPGDTNDTGHDDAAEYGMHSSNSNTTAAAAAAGALTLPYPLDGGMPYPCFIPLSRECDGLVTTTGDDGRVGHDYGDFAVHHQRAGYLAAKARDGHVDVAEEESDEDDDLAYGSLSLSEVRRGREGGASCYPYAGAASHQRQGSQYMASLSVFEQQQQQQQQQPRSYASPTVQPYGTNTPSKQTGNTGSSRNTQVSDITPGISRQSSLGLTRRMDRLSVSGTRPDAFSSTDSSSQQHQHLPPPSPLLEAYRGTYQSLSPMMAPMKLSQDGDLNKLSLLSPDAANPTSGKHRRRSRSRSNSGRVDSIGSGSESGPKEAKKRARLYDAERDALSLNEAISHHKIDVETICNILPLLTHDQMLEVRKEYKKHIKVQGRGINMAKHMKMKLSGNFGKAVYVCALGRYESEGYWANFWYQSHNSRRELLIESLMGRGNAEIRQIKEEFRDKRYGDDLMRCMEKELKPDKFRVAVLAVLEARRQEESEVYPRGYVDKDVEVLNRCLTAREGGESTMLEVVVRRSDAHLREVLKAFELRHGTNFAREVLRKSNNLVASQFPIL